jgi:hypothetical protein
MRAALTTARRAPCENTRMQKRRAAGDKIVLRSITHCDNGYDNIVYTGILTHVMGGFPYTRAPQRD